jgi:hypothetical protein
MSNYMAMGVVSAMYKNHKGIEQINSVEGLSGSNLNVSTKLINRVDIALIPTNTFDKELLGVKADQLTNCSSGRGLRRRQRLVVELTLHTGNTRTTQLAIKTDISGSDIGPLIGTTIKRLTKGVIARMREMVQHLHPFTPITLLLRDMSEQTEIRMEGLITDTGEHSNYLRKLETRIQGK